MFSPKSIDSCSQALFRPPAGIDPGYTEDRIMNITYDNMQTARRHCMAFWVFGF